MCFSEQSAVRPAAPPAADQEGSAGPQRDVHRPARQHCERIHQL